MDWLRSGYRSSMWIFDPAAGSWASFPVRWFRAPRDATIAAFHHQYASANWTKGIAYSQKVGEILSTPRSWDPGAAPVGVVGSNVCGSQWVGELEKLPSPIPDNPLGQPACCDEPPFFVAGGALHLAGSARADIPQEFHAGGALQLAGSAIGEYGYRFQGGGALELAGSIHDPVYHLFRAGGALLLAGGATATGGYGGCSYFPDGIWPIWQLSEGSFAGSCAAFNGFWLYGPPSACLWPSVGPASGHMGVDAFGVYVQFGGFVPDAVYRLDVSSFDPFGTNILALDFSFCGAGNAPAIVYLAPYM